MAFQQIPPGRKIRVTGRQRPNAMQMVRQDDHRIHPEGLPLFGVGKSQTQAINVVNQQTVAFSLSKVHREKPRCTRNINSPIVRHDGCFVVCL